LDVDIEKDVVSNGLSTKYSLFLISLKMYNSLLSCYSRGNITNVTVTTVCTTSKTRATDKERRFFPATPPSTLECTPPHTGRASKRSHSHFEGNFSATAATHATHRQTPDLAC